MYSLAEKEGGGGQSLTVTVPNENFGLLPLPKGFPRGVRNTLGEPSNGIAPFGGSTRWAAERERRRNSLLPRSGEPFDPSRQLTTWPPVRTGNDSSGQLRNFAPVFGRMAIKKRPDFGGQGRGCVGLLQERDLGL